MAQKVVYTVLTGGYDRLQQPEVTAPGWDYICFTDGPAGREGVWELRPIPYEGTPLMRARWAKLHPHVLLPEYTLSVFMDANLCITGTTFYDRCQEAAASGFAALQHPQRDCVWEELRYCYLKDKLSTRAALRHYRHLQDMGMPRHAGLYETNILLRAHLTPAMVLLDEAWWRALTACCPRDQLTFTTVLREQPALLFGEGLNARNVPYVRYTLHPAPSRKKTFWENVSYRLRLWWRKLVLLLCLR